MKLNPLAACCRLKGCSSERLLLFLGEVMRVRVYVDGLNLYYGALKGTGFKWVNLVELVRQLIPADHAIDKLLYFTARVSGTPDIKAPARQQVYLNALNTLSEVEVHLGSFLSKTMWRPLTNLPVAGRDIATPKPTVLPEGVYSVASSGASQMLPVGHYPLRETGQKNKRKTIKPLPNAVIVQVNTKEEKSSDVNLSAHLLNDAWKELFDVAVVVTNDTDLVTPIRMVAVERNKPVFVVCPGRWRIAPKLEAVASYVRHIRPQMLRAAQFPDRIPGTAISKPVGW